VLRSIEAGDLAKKYNKVMEKIAREINEEQEGSKTFGVVFQPGLTEFKSGSSPYGQGYMSGLDWYDIVNVDYEESAGQFI